MSDTPETLRHTLSTSEVERHPGPFIGPDAELARACAMAVIPWYGNDDTETHQRILKNGIWNDHVAVQAALAAIHNARNSHERLTAQVAELEALLVQNMPAAQRAEQEHRRYLDASRRADQYRKERDTWKVAAGAEAELGKQWMDRAINAEAALSAADGGRHG